MPPPTRLVRFVEAMSLVYGPLTHLTPATAASWTPPANPGAGGHRGRYLWTDAFGVLNLITLHRETSDVVYLAAARRLVETVHDVLGRQRGDGNDDDNDNTKKPDRLPGATDAEPLAGGLRIGKREATGPDGDGQYHHYLTLWMFALNRLALAVGDDDGGAGARYNELAVQLARAIHPHFVLRGDRDDSLRMVWKVSTDLRAVLVPSEGHLDAATGYVVYRLLQEAAVHRTTAASCPARAS
ncbi:hypothetical protein VTK73DRAFT_2391 [Phialemonium thermophilum]|uniref:Uncharacterized protein n=1 Tax=Phialemonium thermophilum TaxID=223376 RepID=A0ABR3VS71_9PEZI